MEWTNGTYRVSDDLGCFDMDFVVRMLGGSYWAAGRPRAVIEQSFRSALAVGLFAGTRQIGFARVITDRLTFSWICDVMVDEAYRGVGLGHWLMECLLRHPDVAGTTQLLNTRDAHGFYADLGFVRGEVLSRLPLPAQAHAPTDAPSQ